MNRSDRIDALEQRLRGQLVGLGALALEMHRRGYLDQALLMRAAAETAETERELAELESSEGGEGASRVSR